MSCRIDRIMGQNKKSALLLAMMIVVGLFSAMPITVLAATKPATSDLAVNDIINTSTNQTSAPIRRNFKKKGDDNFGI